MQQARNYCQQLDELNQERKQIETEMKEQAMLALDKLSSMRIKPIIYRLLYVFLIKPGIKG